MARQEEGLAPQQIYDYQRVCRDASMVFDALKFPRRPGFIEENQRTIQQMAKRLSQHTYNALLAYTTVPLESGEVLEVKEPDEIDRILFGAAERVVEWVQGYKLRGSEYLTDPMAVLFQARLDFERLAEDPNEVFDYRSAIRLLQKSEVGFEELQVKADEAARSYYSAS